MVASVRCVGADKLLAELDALIWFEHQPARPLQFGIMQLSYLIEENCFLVEQVGRPSKRKQNELFDFDS